MARPDDSPYTSPRNDEGSASGGVPSTGGTVLDENPGGTNTGGTTTTPDAGPDDSRAGGAKSERSTNFKPVYAPTSSVKSSGTQKAPIATVQMVPAGRDSGKELRIPRFLGLMTRPKRGDAPLGALQDMKNLLVNKKTGALSLRFGSSAYALPSADVSGTFTPTTGSHLFAGEFEVEVPANTAHIISYASDGASSAILQKNFYPNSSTVNTGAVKWGETLADTVASASGTTVTFVGGYNVANYFKNWILYNSDQGDYVYVTASSYLAGTTTLTILENVPTGWTGGDTITLYRHFHDNPTFAPTYSSPIALQQGQGILFSGGQSSSVGCKPILSLYISKILFDGATKEIEFTGTYVTEAEIKSTAGFSGGACSAYTPTSGFGTAARWFMAYVLETDDGQRSQLIHPSTRYADLTAAQGIQNTVTFTSQLNKRMRYLHTLVGYSEDATATTLDWTRYYLVKTTDLTVGSEFTYNESTGASGNWTKTIQLASADYEGRGEDATVFLGHTEAANTTVSFSKAVYVNNRLFVARYYDYTAALNYDDQIRYSVFASNGVAQLNVLAAVPEATESQVEPGDPAVIRGMARYEDKLFIAKDDSCYYVPVDFADVVTGATSPTLTTIARIGCDVGGSVVATPFGIVFAKAGEDVYLWDGGYPRPLTRHWQNTFKTLVPSSAWYEKETRSYNILTDVSSATTWYSMSFDVLVDGEYVWVKHYSQILFDAAFLAQDSGGYPVFTAIDDTTRVTFRRISSATTDATTGAAGIVPYFKTAPIVLSERHVAKAREFYLAIEGISGGSGTLDLKLTTSGAVGSAAQTYSGVSKTETLHVRKVNPITGRGRQFEFEYNANATPATFTALQINEFGITYDIVPTRGDSVKTS